MYIYFQLYVAVLLSWTLDLIRGGGHIQILYLNLLHVTFNRLQKSLSLTPMRLYDLNYFFMVSLKALGKKLLFSLVVRFRAQT